MRFLPVLVILFTALAAPLTSHAQGMMGPGSGPCMPYGHFYPGPRWGGPYGTRAHVKTADDAKQIITSFFSSQGQKVTVGRMEEHGWYFRAEVLDQKGGLLDLVIVDKRTGRLRSTY